MSEWVIKRGLQRPGIDNYLYHRHDGPKHFGDPTWRLAIKHTDEYGNKPYGRWYCVCCREEAPKEIQFAAKLCGCYG